MESRFSTGLTSALLSTLLGLALTTQANAGMTKGQFLVSVTVVNVCRMGQSGASALSRYTGFSLACAPGTDYTVQVSSPASGEAVRSADTDAAGVTSVTVRF